MLRKMGLFVITLSACDAFRDSPKKKSNRYQKPVVAVYDNSFYVFKPIPKGKDYNANDIVFDPYSDTGTITKTCSDPALLICVEKPFHIFLPKTKKFQVYKNEVGKEFYIKVITDPMFKQSDDVCSLKYYWVHVTDSDNQWEEFFTISAEKGIEEIVTIDKVMNPFRSNSPVATYRLTDGVLFSQKEICEKN